MMKAHPRRRALFSPPPPIQDNYIPAVPPIPHNIQGRRTLPSQALPEFADVVRPLDHPLSFEELIRRSPPPRDIQRYERNDNRRPTIGLGGALVSVNVYDEDYRPHRHNIHVHPPDNVPEVNAPAGLWATFTGGIGMDLLHSFYTRFGGEPEQPPRMEENIRMAPRNHISTKTRRHNTLPEYLPTYTHPDKPEPGFSFNFSPQDTLSSSSDPGPSTAVTDLSTVIVCSHCLDPLVTNTTGSVEQIRNTKLWALRCGHLLDGKCIEKLYKPGPKKIPDDPPVEQAQISEDIAKLQYRERGKQSKVEGEHFVDGKGKQKMVVEPQLSNPGMPLMDSTSASASSHRKKRRRLLGHDGIAGEEATNSDPPEASMRSRLRPRRPNPTIQVTSSNDGSVHMESTITLNGFTYHSTGFTTMANVTDGPTTQNEAGRASRESRQPRQRGGGKRKFKGKGKGKATAPVVEEVYAWNCPVTNCGHIHKSIRINNEWLMDETQGAIAMYL